MMKLKRNGEKCQSQHAGHKGHGWMMVLCIFVMLAAVAYTLSSTIELFSLAFFGSALLPIILCLVMHGVMMKFMMSNNSSGED